MKGFPNFSLNDNPPRHKALGGYLYDKGENDELFQNRSSTIYKYIILSFFKNVNRLKEIFLKNFFVTLSTTKCYKLTK